MDTIREPGTFAEVKNEKKEIIEACSAAGGTQEEKDSDNFEIDASAREPSPKRMKIEVTSPIRDVENGDTPPPEEPLIGIEEEAKSLKRLIEAKEEELRQLELVQYYRNKWSKEELKAIIDQWKGIAKESFEDLYLKSTTGNPNLTREALLEHFRVDPKLIDLE